MHWTTSILLIPRYKKTSGYGSSARYKRVNSEPIKVAKLSCNMDDATSLTRLILIGHTLNVPVHYDFKTQTAFIEIASWESVFNATRE